ncbi:MAG: class I tRNA ligase family protein, partial [Pseudomonadota bacterium]
GTTEILPEQHKKVYFNWLENIEPWCISRQLWWGHQIPVWYAVEADLSKDGAQTTKIENAELANEYARGFAEKSAERREAREKRLLSRNPETSLFCAPSEEALREAIEEKAIAEHGYLEVVFCDTVEEACEKTLSSKGYTLCLYRDPDVLDTWFSSGLWPIGTLGWPEETDELKKYFPTSVLITGFDIIFFWVARMMMMQYATVDDRPFDTVYVHALVRDEKGKKMSKSLGNVLDPLELVDEYGADAVRFTLTSMAAMGRDLKLSTQRIQGYRNFTTKLWNAARFAEMNGVFDVTTRTPDAATHSVNKWIIGEVAKTRKSLDEALTAFRFNDAANTLYAFTYTYCDWYLEFSKPLMQSDAATETRQTMAWALDQMLIMLHPIMPFITEELWSLSAPSRAKPCVHADWPTYGDEMIDEAAVAELNWVRDLIEKTRSVRGLMNVPKKQQVTLAQLALEPAKDTFWTANETLILADREAGIAGRASMEAAPKGAPTIAVEGGTFALPLEGLIDAGAEKARLQKSVGKLQKEVGGLEGRLTNPKFRENASAEVIEETEDNARTRREELTRLETALARLEELA